MKLSSHNCEQGYHMEYHNFHRQYHKYAKKYEANVVSTPTHFTSDA